MLSLPLGQIRSQTLEETAVDWTAIEYALAVSVYTALNYIVQEGAGKTMLWSGSIAGLD